MANTSKSSLDNIVKEVLSVGNQEQNFFWPPSVISSQVNAVTSFLLDRLVKTYPENVDMLLPFMQSKKIPVKSGFIDIPDEYRNLLGAPSINVRDDGSDCSDPVKIDTEREFTLVKLKKGCKTRPVTIVDKGQWDWQTTSSYDAPDYDNPIGLYVGKQIKVCPFDIKFVELSFVKKEKVYKYGYILQPDDTFIFDPATSEDTEWDNAASSVLVKAMLALYGAYSRDNAITDWTRILIQENIL